MSESSTFSWVTSPMALRIAAAESGSLSLASASAISLTSVSVSWLPSSANSGM